MKSCEDNYLKTNVSVCVRYHTIKWNWLVVLRGLSSRIIEFLFVIIIKGNTITTISTPIIDNIL